MHTQWREHTYAVYRLAALLLVALLLLSGAPAVMAQDDAAAGPWAAGGAYQITLSTTDVRATAHASASVTAAAPDAAGGGYVLLLPAEVQGTGTPCCCMHLPCIKR